MQRYQYNEDSRTMLCTSTTATCAAAGSLERFRRWVGLIVAQCSIVGAVVGDTVTAMKIVATDSAPGK